MAAPQTKDDLLKMKLPEIKKFVKKNNILTGYTNMRKAVLIGEILISKWWREREKQKQEEEKKQSVKQPVEPVAEMGGEATKEKKPKKIVDTYYNKELVDEYFSIVGRSLVPYEKSDMKVPIDKYYENIEEQMWKELKSGKKKVVLQEDPAGLIKLTGKVKKISEDKPVEQKPTVEEIKKVEKKIQLVPKTAVLETVAKKPTEFDIQQVSKDVKMLPKQIESSEIILPTADVVIPMASPSIGGVKDVLTGEQYVRIIQNVKSEFDKFKSKIDGMLSLF